MKLSANNIKFIDSYLINSGVKYIDIRVEMVDHIATALEEMDVDFYEGFKMYMAKHKAQLLKTNSNFAYNALVNALKYLGTELLGPWFLLPVAIMVAGLYLSGGPDEDSQYIAEGIYSTAVVAFAMYFVYRRFIKKFPYSMADALICSATFLIYLSNRIMIFRGLGDGYRLGSYIICTAFAIAAFRSYNKLMKNYKERYHA
ncbi:MAG: hypothetical protein ACO1N9_14345 [Flavobacterium sp.]